LSIPATCNRALPASQQRPRPGVRYLAADAGLRATALCQALLSYLLGAVILATTINLVAGLLG
jgi:hypothetical protein